MRVIDRVHRDTANGRAFTPPARRAGLAAEGVNFPAHFLIRVETPAGKREILDPFDGGHARSPADLRGLIKRFGGEDAESAATTARLLARARLIVGLHPDEA